MLFRSDRGSEPITRVGLEEQFPDKIRLLGQAEEILYTCLSSFTDGEAWSIASNAPEGHVLEAYRRLCFRFDPTTATSFPPWSVLSGLSSMILGRPLKHWRKRSRPTRVGEVPGGEREALPDDVKTGALQSMCPESLQTHLSMNSKRLTCYTEVRAEITSYIVARVGIRMKTPASTIQTPWALDSCSSNLPL